MRNNAKKYVAGISLVTLFGVYSAYQYLSDSGPMSYTAAPLVHTAARAMKSETGVLAFSQTTPPIVSKRTSMPTKASHAPMVQKFASGYQDGTYTGVSADAYYGNVQVQIAVHGGVVTDVVALQSPDTHNHSIAINSYALPILRSEAISSQNARINAVSGATYTSEAYKQSIASALSQANA